MICKTFSKLIFLATCIIVLSLPIGRARAADLFFDIGPVIVASAVMAAVYGNTCPEDFNGDATVGPFDLAFVLGNWGPCNGSCPADLDDDGSVGSFDLALLLDAWGQCPGPGACCLPDTCEEQSEALCSFNGGFHEGPGTTCGPGASKRPYFFAPRRARAARGAGRIVH